MRVYLFIAAIAGGVTWLLTPLVRHLAIHIGAVGKVRARDVHTVPTPRMGGLAMLLGFAVALVFASRMPFVSGLFVNSRQAWVVLAGAAMVCLLGVADDLWDLDWMLKLAGQLLISVFAAYGGLQIISLPLGSLVTASPTISMAITAFLIVASINAVNFVDGLDGLASGIVAIGGIAFAIYSYILARSSASFASMATLIDVAMVGICVGFILHNWHPAKLFMGDSGSMLLGYLITCASIVMTGHLDPASVGHKSLYLPVFMPIMLPILVLFLPVLDMSLAIVRRLRKGQSPMHPDRMHLHHRMLRIGHSVQGAVLILWGWAALISFGSIMILFFKAVYVLVGMLLAAVVLTVLTMSPYLLRRAREIRQEEKGLVWTTSQHASGRAEVLSHDARTESGEDEPAAAATAVPKLLARPEEVKEPTAAGRADDTAPAGMLADGEDRLGR
ncbi:MraY family glycosyltransferase [Bifidobacterium aemilianum]|uniref:MraY family glycosyltransferase n=1 Tax=Bifidobacterium aemilianum TaxID=2493120 RepID=UPI001F44B4FC|nr:MraY family glycosyltransferase [Bifidobacterium aemilianum]